MLPLCSSGQRTSSSWVTMLLDTSRVARPQENPKGLACGEANQGPRGLACGEASTQHGALGLGQPMHGTHLLLGYFISFVSAWNRAVLLRAPGQTLARFSACTTGIEHVAMKSSSRCTPRGGALVAVGTAHAATINLPFGYFFPFWILP